MSVNHENFQWAIVGGGIHGVHIAIRLLESGRVSPEQLCIVDPHRRLLQRWRDCTAVTGMTHLRSPSVHNLDADPWALQNFARISPDETFESSFAPPYKRPSLDLFNAHASHLVERYELDKIHRVDRAVQCDAGDENVRIELDGGESIVCDHGVFALGRSEWPRWPAWAPRDQPGVQHIFASSFSQQSWVDGANVAVIGGGISAGQFALRILDEGFEPTLISRHGFREHQFDSDPGWLGPKRMAAFAQISDPDERRSIIDRARNSGSVPPKLSRRLNAASRQGTMTIRQSRILSCVVKDETVLLGLCDGSILSFDAVVLATGFQACRPGGGMLDELVLSASLPCASCGFPRVDESLRWNSRIFVAGPLAELELGPAAQNIAGARRAADRILAAPQGVA